MTPFLTVVVLILGVVALIQLIRVFELTSVLKGKASELPSFSETKFQARMMIPLLIGMFAFFTWCYFRYKDHLLPEAASEHGGSLDTLLNFNFLIIIVVFAITHVVLFWFAYKYHARPGQKATFFAHSNKLELIWTTVPALFLAVIIVYGLKEWNTIMDKAPKDSLTIELYSKQFDWTARYAGADSTLGSANYNLISGTNPLGVITEATIMEKLAELKKKDSVLVDKLATVPQDGEIAEDIKDEIARLARHKSRVMVFKDMQASKDFTAADDDMVMKGEFHLPKGTTVGFQFRSQDVIHSAYMPHFRAQMNTVPGMLTKFVFKPIYTTEEMRKKTGNPDFNYLLLCNKICGTAHYNMQMTIVVDEPEDYARWEAEQKAFDGSVVGETATTVSGEQTQLAVKAN